MLIREIDKLILFMICIVVAFLFTSLDFFYTKFPFYKSDCSCIIFTIVLTIML